MAGYIGSTPVPQGIKETQSFTATAGQTTFNTFGYSDGNNISVFLNGVRLINGTDYTASNGSDIVLTAAASASDVLDFETFNEVSLVNQEFTNSISVEGDGTSDTAVVTVQNSTKENTDGGRESRLRFRGFRSGDVGRHTLAEIQGEHDGTGADQKGNLIFKTNDGSDNAAPTEAFRVDSAQNLLVGTSTANPTSSAVNNAGQEFSPTGGVRSTVASNAAATFNRKTDDGPVVLIRKDGSTVGAIGSSSGTDLTIGSGDTGFRFLAASDEIIPWNASGNTTNSDAINIGKDSQRFKDLYLSGGAYIGGTATGNKLDDFEEGNWTPTYTLSSVAPDSVSYHASVNGGFYRKIGSFVFISGVLYTTSVTIGSGSGTLRIGGLPFAVGAMSAGQSRYSSLYIGETTAFTGEHPISGRFVPSATLIDLFYRSSVTGDSQTNTGADLNTGTNKNLLRFGGSYTTT